MKEIRTEGRTKDWVGVGKSEPWLQLWYGLRNRGHVSSITALVHLYKYKKVELDGL